MPKTEREPREMTDEEWDEYARKHEEENIYEMLPRCKHLDKPMVVVKR